MMLTWKPWTILITKWQFWKNVATCTIRKSSTKMRLRYSLKATTLTANQRAIRVMRVSKVLRQRLLKFWLIALFLTINLINRPALLLMPPLFWINLMLPTRRRCSGAHMLTAPRANGRKLVATCRPYSGRILRTTNSRKTLTSAWASFWSNNVRRRRHKLWLVLSKLKSLRQRPLRSKKLRRIPPNLKKFKSQRKLPQTVMTRQLLRPHSRRRPIRRKKL